MLIPVFYRYLLIFALVFCLIFDYPVALRSLATEGLISDEDQEITNGYPWADSDLSENINAYSISDPKEDFHLYACKDLLIEKKYIDGYSAWNNYSEAATLVDSRAMELLEQDDLEGHDAALVQDMYDLLLDWDARDKTGFNEIKKLTDPVLEADSLEELTEYLLTTDGLIFLVNFVSIGIHPSYNDSGHNAVFISPESLLLDDPAEYETLTEYGEMTDSYNKKMFLYYSGRAGMDEGTAKKMFESARELENKLSRKMFTAEETLRDDYVERANNEMTYEELEELSGNFPLTDILKASDNVYDGVYVVTEPEYLKYLNEIYTEENLEAIRSIVYINALLDLGEYTDKAARDYELDTENECYGTSYWYTDEEVAYDKLQNILPEPLGKIYVDAYGSAEDRKKLENVCEEVIENYREMLSDNPWTSGKTKEQAINKLNAIDICVAYPDHWTDYSKLSFDGCTLYTALRDTVAFYDALEDESIGKPVDKSCWAREVNTLECNAFYDPAENTVYICMGMMEKPFYYPDMPIEELYASVAGFWIGHEISHSFDSNGARYDAEGNLRNWWTKEDRDAFESRIEKLDAYLDTIVPFGDYHVTGKSVDTEMLADITGLQCALKMAGKVPDFDYDSFFRCYAKLNVSIIFYSQELSLLLYDPHPLNYLRTNVAVQQFDEFYETYDVKPGDTMYLAPPQRVAVW